jgi:hypothetical protein
MLWIAAAAAFVAPPPEVPAQHGTGPLAQARATVRIVAGTRVHFGAASTDDIPAPHDRSIRTQSGLQMARLIEFE